jgi:hypothetical protein
MTNALMKLAPEVGAGQFSECDPGILHLARKIAVDFHADADLT